ncbi:MAG: OB-fold domain-containing protein [Syntrophobacterales bacterium]|nr:OB-fold domain-containing protein [Syntrophobacterales bacterium]
MVGIVAFGAYLPRYRLERKEIAKAISWINPPTLGFASGEKTVANYDEDAITLAVAASRNALSSISLPDEKMFIYAASTSFPYAERLNAAIISEALGYGEVSSTADFSGSSRAGTAALIAGLNAIQSGDTSWGIVTAGEVRKTKPGSTDEFLQGDGGATVVLGREKVIASFRGSLSISGDFPSPLRESSKSFPRLWEERWIRDEGFMKIIPSAVKSYLARHDLSPSNFRFLIYPCHYPREHGIIGKMAGFSDEQIFNPLLVQVGDTGAAHTLVLLAAALEECQPADEILLVGYGSGVDLLHFKATELIREIRPVRSLESLLLRKAPISYQKFLAFREVLEVETGLRGEFQAETPLSVMWRNRKAILGLVGSRCLRCGVPQFPPQRICVIAECQAVDAMEPYNFSKKKAVVFSYTGDNLAFSYDPPQIYGLIDFEEGGRMMLDFTDCALEDLKVGMGVELSFRRKYHDRHRGIHTYFWKAIPMVN